MYKKDPDKIDALEFKLRVGPVYGVMNDYDYALERERREAAGTYPYRSYQPEIHGPERSHRKRWAMYVVLHGFTAFLGYLAGFAVGSG